MFLIKDTYYQRNLKLSKSKEKYICFSVKKRIQIGVFVSGRSRSDKPRQSAVMYLCARGIKCASFYAFYIGFWNCSNSAFFHFNAHPYAKHQTINQSINQSINLRFVCCLFSYMHADSSGGSWSMLCSIIDMLKCKLVLTYFIVQI